MRVWSLALLTVLSRPWLHLWDSRDDSLGIRHGGSTVYTLESATPAGIAPKGHAGLSGDGEGRDDAPEFDASLAATPDGPPAPARADAPAATPGETCLWRRLLAPGWVLEGSGWYAWLGHAEAAVLLAAQLWQWWRRRLRAAATAAGADGAGRLAAERREAEVQTSSAGLDYIVEVLTRRAGEAAREGDELRRQAAAASRRREELEAEVNQYTKELTTLRETVVELGRRARSRDEHNDVQARRLSQALDELQRARSRGTEMEASQQHSEASVQRMESEQRRATQSLRSELRVARAELEGREQELRATRAELQSLCEMGFPQHGRAAGAAELRPPAGVPAGVPSAGLPAGVPAGAESAGSDLDSGHPATPSLSSCATPNSSVAGGFAGDRCLAAADATGPAAPATASSRAGGGSAGTGGSVIARARALDQVLQANVRRLAAQASTTSARPEAPPDAPQGPAAAGLTTDARRNTMPQISFIAAPDADAQMREKLAVRRRDREELGPERPSQAPMAAAALRAASAASSSGAGSAGARKCASAPAAPGRAQVQTFVIHTQRDSGSVSSGSPQESRSSSCSLGSSVSRATSNSGSATVPASGDGFGPGAGAGPGARAGPGPGPSPGPLGRRSRVIAVPELPLGVAQLGHGSALLGRPLPVA